MAIISITTTQNVTIDHNLADFRQRLSAFFLDFLIILSWIIIHRIIAILLIPNPTLNDIYFYIMVIPFFSFYTLIMEYFMNGQTPGKRAMNIRVVKLNGNEPVFMDYFIRWSLRFIEIYLSFGVLASVMINTTQLNQRFADIIAGTVLVNIHIKQNISVDDLIKMSAQNSHEVSYPEVITFTETEMLLIKKLVDRYLNVQNESHRLLVVETANKLSHKLGVTMKEKKPELFLKTLIRDYVILTR
jgi:uncharacterized RDD family membrane protein YckC